MITYDKSFLKRSLVSQLHLTPAVLRSRDTFRLCNFGTRLSRPFTRPLRFSHCSLCSVSACAHILYILPLRLHLRRCSQRCFFPTLVTTAQTMIFGRLPSFDRTDEGDRLHFRASLICTFLFVSGTSTSVTGRYSGHVTSAASMATGTAPWWCLRPREHHHPRAVVL